MKEQVLLNLCEMWAASERDGHFTLLRFTTGWKCVFGTPEPFREKVWKLPAFKTAGGAMAWALSEEMDRALSFFEIPP